ncbi:MAG: hypothetical protein ABR529_05195 [Actinomycetota bacterium]
MPRRSIVAVSLAVLFPMLLGTVAALAGGLQARTDTKRLVRTNQGKSVERRPSESRKGKVAVSAEVQTEPAVEAPEEPAVEAPEESSLDTSSSSGVKSYVFVNSKELATVAPSTSVAIVKGRLPSKDFRQTNEMTSFLTSLVNYEQSAALNDTEAAFAESMGYLAKTCSGDVIHPRNIPQVTLMNLANPEAVAWRAAMVSDETATGYDQTYLDTLGAFYPDSFYTGHPCVDGVPVTNTQWRDGSVALISAVRDLTGKPVIANGRALGASGGYFKNQADADMLITAADGIQIEQFARSTTPERLAQDVAYLQVLAAKGKTAYAKCKSTLAICEATFAGGAGPDAYLAAPDG